MEKIIYGDIRHVLPTIPDNTFTSIVTDPPYELGFMGKKWDSSGIAFNVDVWKEALRVAKPGAMLLAFGGTRTYHRMTCAIEDAGWEIRDCIMWIYGSGFPKSLDISKAIDKAAGVERKVVRELDTTYGMNKRRVELGYRPNEVKPGAITAPSTDLACQWDGWGTALKPAYEPIILAMKPVDKTFANNAEKWGVAGLNIDGGRIETSDPLGGGAEKAETVCSNHNVAWDRPWNHRPESRESHAAIVREHVQKAESLGRWPSNVILDEEAGEMLDKQSGRAGGGFGTANRNKSRGRYGDFSGIDNGRAVGYGDTGGASRFFYCAKASPSERGTINTCPTVKPLSLMRYLITLVSLPSGGLILDPFGGSGSTGMAAKSMGKDIVLIDSNLDHCMIAMERIGTAELEMVD